MAAQDAREPAWVDLSHPLARDTPHLASQPPFEAEPLRRLGPDRTSVTNIAMCTHTGTHVDAPAHAVVGGATIDAYTADDLHGIGSVATVQADDSGLVRRSALEDDAVPADADVLFVDTGWERHYGRPEYFDHPSLSEDAADWIVERGFRMVGFDLLSPELPLHRRPDDFDFPIHRRLLSAGTLVMENVANLPAVRGLASFPVVVAPLILDGLDGSPCRIMARVDGG